MTDRARRPLVTAFLVVAVLGAAALMISSVVDTPARTAWQVLSLIACVGGGAVWSILTHRWWPGGETVGPPDARRPGRWS